MRPIFSPRTRVKERSPLAVGWASRVAGMRLPLGASALACATWGGGAAGYVPACVTLAAAVSSGMAAGGTVAPPAEACIPLAGLLPLATPIKPAEADFSALLRLGDALLSAGFSPL